MGADWIAAHASGGTVGAAIVIVLSIDDDAREGRYHVVRSTLTGRIARSRRDHAHALMLLAKAWPEAAALELVDVSTPDVPMYRATVRSALGGEA